MVWMAFHFRENCANWLTNPAFDSISATAEYKACAVRIERINGVGAESHESRVEGQGTGVEGLESKVESPVAQVESQGTRVESPVAKVESRKSKAKSQKPKTKAKK